MLVFFFLAVLFQSLVMYFVVVYRHCLCPPCPGWASCDTTPIWPGVRTTCLASLSSWRQSWISSRVASSMTWRNTAIRCITASVSVVLQFASLFTCFALFNICSYGCCLLELMRCLCLSEASEKMLKAWQENEERAAAFAQVNYLKMSLSWHPQHVPALSAGGRSEPLGRWDLISAFGDSWASEEPLCSPARR